MRLSQAAVFVPMIELLGNDECHVRSRPTGPHRHLLHDNGYKKAEWC